MEYVFIFDVQGKPCNLAVRADSIEQAWGLFKKFIIEGNHDMHTRPSVVVG